MKDWRAMRKGPIPPQELARIKAELAEKVTRKHTGVPHTPETRAKIGARRAAAHKAKHGPQPSPEDLAKQIAAARSRLGASQAR